MAKQAVSSFERHVEKGVLGITAVLLLAAVATFLVRSPSTIEMDGQVVGPGQIDDRVHEKAQALRTTIDRATTEVERPDDPSEALKDSESWMASAGLTATWPAPVPMLPMVPDVGPASVAGEKVLVEVAPPQKPKVKVGRSTLILLPSVFLSQEPEEAELTEEENRPYETPVNWCTVAAVFDRKEQAHLCKLAGYEPGRRQAYVVGVELERRRQQRDGTWPEEWEPVRTYARYLTPELPQVELTTPKDGGPPVADTQTREQVREYFALVKQEQAEIIRPLFPQVVDGDDWWYPQFPAVDLDQLDAELLDPKNEVADEELKRYGEPPKGPEQQPEKPTPTRVQEKETLDKIKSLRDQGKLEEALELARSLANSATLPAHKRAAQELVTEIEQLIKDQEREKSHTPGASEEEEEQTVRPVSPVQVVWAHDAEAGSVESGATYQYRTRVLLYNRYVAVPEQLKDPQQAERLFLVGPWSEPSDPVNTPLDTQFFLTSGGTKEDDRVKLDVFKWFEGYWVRQNFTVGPGDRIGEKRRASIPDERPMVDFDTGSVVVDIERDRPIRERSNKGNEDSFDFEKLGSTVALVYVDPNGHLRERLLGVDKDDPEYKAMKDKVWKPEKERKAREAPPPQSKRGGRPPGGRSGGRGRGHGGRGGGAGGGGGGGGGGLPGAS